MSDDLLERLKDAANFYQLPEGIEAIEAIKQLNERCDELFALAMEQALLYEAEKATADDLAAELRETVAAWKAALREPTTVAAGLLADRLEGVHRVEARYREARGL
jgi:phosphate uptake regulator